MSETWQLGEGARVGNWQGTVLGTGLVLFDDAERTFTINEKDFWEQVLTLPDNPAGEVIG